MRPRLDRLFVLMAAALVVACDGGPKNGELRFDLVAPNNTTGAVVFTVTATAPYAVEGVSAACGTCQVFVTSVSDQEMRGVVTGALQSGPLLSVSVSDVGRREAYSGAIREAATRDYTLLSVLGYRLDAPR